MAEWDVLETGWPTGPELFGDVKIMFRLEMLHVRWGEDSPVVMAYEARIVAASDRADIGSLRWALREVPVTGGGVLRPGTIMRVEVAETYGRRGIASRMWELAHELPSYPGLVAAVHSPSRTDQGERWAQNVGGFLPPRRGFPVALEPSG